jgi:hypothetical protein
MCFEIGLNKSVPPVDHHIDVNTIGTNDSDWPEQGGHPSGITGENKKAKKGEADSA